MALLRGRFAGATGADMERFSSSLRIDLEMLDEDVRASIAHATMLGETGIVSATEAAELVRGLEQVRAEIEDGRFVPDDALEDVHMAVEARLTEIVGDVGKKIHTARSRNDQVATDVRLWLKRRLGDLDAALVDLIDALLARVESDGRVLLPGYTHLQRGQPVLLGHHLLAHGFALARDRERVAGALGRVDRSPLGACALAGTPHPIDRARTAELLDFAAVMENAMDAVAARDHVQEVAATAAISATHLSRMAEELVIWSSAEFAFVRVDERYATGSSIMPQKRNPDAAELVRGKAARVQGHLMTLLSLVKSLPLAYNRDLQEDREALFDAVATIIDSVRITAAMWRTLRVDPERFERELAGDSSLATELADLLVERGVPFREAHEAVGKLTRHCDEHGLSLAEVSTDVPVQFHPKLAGDLGPWLDPRQAVERRTSRGGTAWPEVERQAAVLRATLPG